MYQLWVLGFDFALCMLETRARDSQMYVSERGGNPKSPLGRTMYTFHTGHVEKKAIGGVLQWEHIGNSSSSFSSI